MKQATEALICFVVGGAFVAAAAFAWLRTRRFVGRAAPAYGEVIGLREHRGKVTTYAPVVRFSCPDGRVIVFTESTASSPPDHGVGDRVRVLYRRENPGDARVASTSSLYLFPVVFAALGGLVFAVGILIAAFAFDS